MPTLPLPCRRCEQRLLLTFLGKVVQREWEVRPRIVGFCGEPAGVSIGWSQALAWRMRRHLLEPVEKESIAGVVARLGAVPAMDDGLAELAVRMRRARSRPGDVARALAEGRIIKSFAFRGRRTTSHPRTVAPTLRSGRPVASGSFPAGRRTTS